MYYMDSTTTADCGCEVEVRYDTYEEGCCDMCVSTTTEIMGATIVKTCGTHG